MEEQQHPVHEEPAIVASKKKHSWSKKEKLALYVAGVFALVGIGFGGYTFYNQVILNAAGEESLGSDVSIDLPPANESPYFTVKSVLEQDVNIVMKGDAMKTTEQGAQYTGELAPGWRIEQTTTPLDDNSWGVVAQSFDFYDTARTAVFADGFDSYSTDGTSPASHVRLQSNLLDRSFKPGYLGTAGSKALNLVTLDDTSNKSVLQPGKTYYFRVSKQTTAADSTSNAPAVWTPQGNYVQVTTKTYSDQGLTIQSDNTTGIKFSWNASAEQQTSLADWNTSLGILREANVNDIYSVNTRVSDVYYIGQDWEGMTNGVLRIDPANLDVSSYNPYTWGSIQSGVIETTQKKDTGYYYALVAIRNSDEQTITAVLSEPKYVSTIAATPQKPLIAVSLSPNSLSADQAKNIAVTVKNSDSSTGSYYENVSSDLTDNNGESVGIGCGNSKFGVTDKTQVLTYKLDLYGCSSVLPGNYIVHTHFSRYYPLPSLEQTVDTPVTLTKIDPKITASYANSSVKYKKDVVITISYTPNDNYDFLSAYASGTFKIVNLNTKKTIKTFSWDTYATGGKKKITLKGVKKGKYNLAIVYTADTKQGVYQDKTINLPKLTVK